MRTPVRNLLVPSSPRQGLSVDYEATTPILYSQPPLSCQLGKLRIFQGEAEPWRRITTTYSTHGRGCDAFENGVEKPRANVVLATAISREHCEKVHLGYVNPTQIRIADYENHGAEGVLVILHDSEILHRLRGATLSTAGPTRARSTTFGDQTIVLGMKTSDTERIAKLSVMPATKSNMTSSLGSAGV